MARLSDEDLDKRILQYEKNCRKPAHLQKKGDRGTLDGLYMERMVRHGGEAGCEEEAELADLLGDNVENYIKANHKPKDTVAALMEDGFDRRLIILFLNRIRGQYRRRAGKRLALHLVLLLLAAGGLVYCFHQLPPSTMETYGDYLRFGFWKRAVTAADDRHLTWLKLAPLIVVVISFFGSLNAFGDFVKVAKSYSEK